MCVCVENPRIPEPLRSEVGHPSAAFGRVRLGLLDVSGDGEADGSPVRHHHAVAEEARLSGPQTARLGGRALKELVGLVADIAGPK